MSRGMHMTGHNQLAYLHAIAGHGQPGPEIPDQAESGLHFGPDSGLIFEPEHRAGLGLGFQFYAF
jgi:hypothetical protein